MLTAHTAACAPTHVSSAANGTTLTARNITTAISQYQARNGKLPGQLSDLCSAGGRCVVPRDDGWGRGFEFEVMDSDYELRSAGPDGRLRTDDDMVYSSATARFTRQKAAGCYRTDLPWIVRNNGLLHLTQVPLRANAGAFRVEPSIWAEGDGRWMTLGDSVYITWDGDAYREVVFAVADRTLWGYAIEGGDEGRPHRVGPFTAVKLENCSN